MLVLYCMKQNLISSVSNIITMNLHVVDVLVSPDLYYQLLICQQGFTTKWLHTNTFRPTKTMTMPFSREGLEAVSVRR